MAFPLTHFHRLFNPQSTYSGSRYSLLPFSLLIVPAATLSPPSSTRNYKRSQLKRMSLNSLAPTFDYIRQIRDNRADNDSCHLRPPCSTPFSRQFPPPRFSTTSSSRQSSSFFGSDRANQFVQFSILEFYDRFVSRNILEGERDQFDDRACFVKREKLITFDWLEE